MKKAQSNTRNAALYDEMLSNIRYGKYSEVISLNSLSFCYPESYIDLPDGRSDNEPVENMTTTWRYSFEKTDNGFTANVVLRIEIPSVEPDNEQPISLSVGYSINYYSDINLISEFTKRFAYEKTLPQVWPYFRELAKDIFHKAGLLWVIVPIEPNSIERKER